MNRIIVPILYKDDCDDPCHYTITFQLNAKNNVVKITAISVVTERIVMHTKMIVDICSLLSLLLERKISLTDIKKTLTSGIAASLVDKAMEIEFGQKERN